MSDKLYDWETRQYVNCSDLTKDGTKWINRNRKELVYDENIEQYADNKDYYDSDLLKREFYKCLQSNDLCLCLLSEYGYNQTEIAYITNVSQKTVSKRLSHLKHLLEFYLSF
jgi:hypothetical protein